MQYEESISNITKSVELVRYGRTSMKPAAEKSWSKAKASRSRRWRITSKLVASTNEYPPFVPTPEP